MNPLLPIFMLIFGAIGVLVGLLPNFRWTGLVALISALFALLGILFMFFRLPVSVTLSHWEPEVLFPQGLRLAADGLSWLFALALMLVLLAVFLTSAARPGGARVLARVLSLLIVAAALAAIFSDSLIALAISWAALDGIYFLALALLNKSRTVDDNAVLALGLNMLSSALVVAAALVTIREGGAGLLSDAQLPVLAVVLVIGAGMLRLGIFPFHTVVPSMARIGLGVDTLLRLAPAAVAFELLARVATHPGSEQLPLVGWLTAAAALGMLFGAVQWWLGPYPPAGLSYVVLAYSGMGVLVLLWGGPAASIGLTALGCAVLIGGSVLFLSNRAQYGPWRIPVLIGVAILAGTPLTVGFVGLWATFAGLVEAGGLMLLVLAAVLVAQVLLVASYLRLTFFEAVLDVPLPQGEPWIGVAYLFGMVLPLLMGLLLGLAPTLLASAVGVERDSMPPLGVMPIVLSLTPIFLGGLLWYFEGLVRAGADKVWDTLAYATQLDWLYATLWDVYGFIGRVLHTAAAIVEGEGGVLWTLVVVLLVWLVLTGG